MARAQHAVRSFSSGVWSPRLTLRSDADKFDTALSRAINWVITPQGGATYRSGFQYIADAGNPTDASRMLTFRNGGNESDILIEMGAGSNRFYQNDLILRFNLAPQIIDNSYLQSELVDVQFSNQQSLGVSVHGEHPPQYITIEPGQKITEFELPFHKVPEQQYFDTKSPTGVSTDSEYLVAFFSGWTEGLAFNFTYDGQVNTSTQEGLLLPKDYNYTADAVAMTSRLQRMFSDATGLLTSDFTVTNPTADQYSVSFSSTVAGRTASISGGGSATVTLVSGVNSGFEPAWSYPYVVKNGNAYYQCDVAHTASTDSQPGVGLNWTDYWTLLGDFPPAWWEYQHNSDNDWVNVRIYAPWGRGWPRTVTFHQQRLLFGGSKGSSVTVWGSRIGDYTDFQLGPNDDDPISFTIDTQGTPAIKWMESQNGLLIGTSAGEYLVTSQIALGPGDIKVDKQNSARANLAAPVVIDHEAFYIEQGRNKIRGTRYRREFLGFISEDISIVAEHLFYSRIRRLALLQTPEVMVVALLDDGQLVGLSYNNSQSFAAWYQFETSGVVEDITSIYSVEREEDELYAVVNRGGNNVLERMPYPKRVFLSGDTFFYLDSYVTGSGPITGLDHLDDMVVGVIDNNAWKGDYTVSGGTVSYTPTGNWVVGLRYGASLTPFEQSPGDGVLFGTARRWNKMYVRLIDSAVPLINGTRPPDRGKSSPMDVVEGLRSQNVKVTSLGVDDGSFTIEQDLPFPTHVLGVYGQFSIENA